MKRVLTVCLLGFLSSLAVATPVEYTDEQLKDYVILTNNVNKCLFPEIWKSPNSDDEMEVLEKWFDNPDTRWKYSHFRRVHMHLAYTIGKENWERFWNKKLSEDTAERLVKAEKKYYRKITAKSPKSCEKVSKWVSNLIENTPLF